ncbi:hypothetical protein M434DRAFT_279245 [Hypoxylon sp. CO27-5]|nr:hypothetical protein M434DRAFT_279245 [Hypoxylon sp. CO27-5]
MSRSMASRSVTSRSTASYTPPLPRCPKCRVAFQSKKALFKHQQDAGHLTCDACDQSFHTLEGLMSHRQEDHRALQDLLCPGCDKNFVSAGGWIQHVEIGECTSIFPSDIAEGIPKIMRTITENLRGVKISGEGTVDYSGPSHIKDVWGDEWKDEETYDVERHPEAFPRTVKQEFYRGGPKQQDLLTGENAESLEQRPQNAWAQKKNLFPEKENTKPIRPPPHLLEQMRQPATLSRPTGERILDPNHPEFNVSLFKDSILEAYKCPHKACNSKYKTSNGLIGHLKSPAHSGNQFPCPGCRGIFTTAASWVQHVETVSLTKCRLREKEDVYGLALNAITDGALDIDTLNKLADDRVKLKVNENWASTKRPSKLAGVVGSEEWLKAKQDELERPLPGPSKVEKPW